MDIRILLLLGIFFFSCESDDDELVDDISAPKQVTKTNPMQIYMHYMPWYHSKEESGYWGSHWRMANRNPENVDADGKREIASHYYPLIGPYDSRDNDVIEYHLLLMKYAGVDAVLIDWYGTHNIYDYKSNLTNSNAFIERIDEVGLQFAIVYEEFTAGNVGEQTSKSAIAAAQEDMAYMQSNYFDQEEYLHIDNSPLLMTFGPRHFRQASQWSQIFENTPELKFLPLWHHRGHVGEHGNGEFSWVDFNPSLSELDLFYNRNLEIQVGSAFPRFHDYYQEGGWGESYGRVYSNGGETLRRTLQKAQENELEYLQLVTWNDFGEGTVLEPTLEDEFLFLEIIQDFTGVPYERAELELIHEYYLKKKEHAGNAAAEEVLQEAFLNLAALQPEQARALMAEL